MGWAGWGGEETAGWGARIDGVRRWAGVLVAAVSPFDRLRAGFAGMPGWRLGAVGRSATRRLDRSGAWVPGLGNWGCVVMGSMVLYLSTDCN